MLATIENTVGAERDLAGDAVTQGNIAAAAREELIHYDTLVSSAVGGRPLTRRIWIPDSVFASRTNLLNTLEVGNQTHRRRRCGAPARAGRASRPGSPGRSRPRPTVTSVGNGSAVHRALACQSLGKP